MPEKKTAPYGSWKSPITPDWIVSETIGLGQIEPDGQDIYWVEARPSEGGRMVIVRRTPDGRTADMTPVPLNARTRVHEYGGKSYLVSGGMIYFSNFSDQRLYVQRAGGEPRPLTPEGDYRYADYILDKSRNRLICVREDHTGPAEAANTLVDIGLESGQSRVLVSGNNFYSNPRLSPDGKRLSWLTWNHPNLPWDGTQLWVGEIRPDGTIGNAEQVAGGDEVSIFQPEWSPGGVLYFVSDITGWWNLHRRWNGKNELIVGMEAEFGVPQWVFGQSVYAFETEDRILCSYVQNGRMYLAHLEIKQGTLKPVETSYTSFWSLKVGRPGQALFGASSPTKPAALVQLDLSSGQASVLRQSSQKEIDAGYLSLAEPVEFPTENGLTAHGFFYAPHNADYQAPAGELPPLLVMSHGGPTGAASDSYDPEIQFWTSRGIAVLDVNYGGSTGYGRAYRERLNGQWGVVDVDDCVNGARYLIAEGRVDGNRLAITGGSAGGYTTLCALTFRDVFKAGASHFGIGDLDTFVKDTHKFESRYLDRLVGPYPERKDLYYQRSAVNFMDRLNVPVILLQGLEDKIVPPNQAEQMFAAVKAKGLPVAYLPFEGEQHGFRRAENIKRALEAELYFYSKVFGFELADPVEPVEIENL